MKAGAFIMIGSHRLIWKGTLAVWLGLYGTLLSVALPVQAQQALSEASTLATLVYPATLPVKPYVWRNAKKLALAETLSSWTIETLQRQKAQVGVLARQGSVFTRLFDPTGMTHSGFVFQDARSKEWITYSLYSDPSNQRRTALLWRQSLKDFFYGQINDRKEALLLLPSADLQAHLLKRIQAEPFQSLLPVQHHYNLVAPVQDPLSFNCTKWVVLNLFAAAHNSQDVPALIARMGQEYPVKTLRPVFLVRWVLKRKKDVRWEELHPPGIVQTVTVESLYQFPLFEKRFLFSRSSG